MRNLDREKHLLTVLNREGTASVHTLASTLAVSDANVRRDLQALENRGLLRRIHGGATLEPEAGSRRELLFAEKEDQNTVAKQAIAEAAFNLIRDGDSIYLDGGSTVLRLARLLDQRSRLTIVTNSLAAVAQLLDTDHRLIVIGGEFRAISRTLVGPLTSDLIGAMHVDLAFLGTIGFCPEHGMTTTDPNEAFTKQQVLAHAAKTVLLADSSKFGVRSFARVGHAANIDVYVTETITKSGRDQLTKLGTEVLLADSQET